MGEMAKTGGEIYRSDNERLIIALLKGDDASALALAEGGRIDPEEVLGLSDRHMVPGIVSDRLARLFPEGSPLEKFSPDRGRAALAAAAVNLRLRYELKLAAGILGEGGIDCILIKGFSVDHDPLRWMNDIDILIRGEDLGRAFGVLGEAGYCYMGSGVMSEEEKRNPFGTLGWNNQFQFLSPSGFVSVEVHTNLFERDRIRLENLDRLLDRVDLFWEGRTRDEGLGCSVPSPEAALALLCVHSATKRSPAHNTCILRHAYDIAGILGRGVEDDRFLFLCGEWKIEYYAYTALKLADLALGSGKAPELAGRLEQALTSPQRRLSELHLRCFRGLGNAPVFRRKLYALYMPFAIGGSFRKALRWYREQVFPPLWVQERRFGIRRTSPAIYLTYLFGPFIRIYKLVSRRLHPG